MFLKEDHKTEVKSSRDHEQTKTICFFLASHQRFRYVLDTVLFTSGTSSIFSGLSSM